MQASLLSLLFSLTTPVKEIEFKSARLETRELNEQAIPFIPRALAYVRYRREITLRFSANLGGFPGYDVRTFYAVALTSKVDLPLAAIGF
jgi:hypothetical protein